MITGVGIPKFIDQASNEVLLEYAKILEDAPSYRTIEQESVINNYINNIHLGVHWVFQVRIHLFKQGPNTAITKYAELISYLGSEVYLWRHEKGNAFQDSSGANVLFRVQEVTPSYFETPDFKDIITIIFKSVRPIDLSKIVLPDDTIFSRKGDNYYPDVDSEGNIMTYNTEE